MIGHYEMDVFGEAARSVGGAIVVDFLQGTIIEGEPSPSLEKSVALYHEAFSYLCSKAGGSLTDFTEAKGRFWSDRLSRRCAVTVMGRDGRGSTTEYAGTPLQRVKVLDSMGRLRPKHSIALG